MAIAFARARYISRSTGGSATRSAAYNARETVVDQRTGENYSFAHRDTPEHHEVMLPEGADARLADSAVLWNMAEQAERRRDAQVAREIVIALPANAELTDEDRLALVRGFADEHFVKAGLAVQLDIHSPHEGDEGSEVANHHAHLLITTRRVEGDRLSAKKARDLDPQVRQFGNRPGVTEADAWGALWREHQDRYFAEHGLDIRVDAPGAVAQAHVGPVRMRAPESEAVIRAEEIARENALAARDPDRVLAVLTRNNATFTERDVDRHLAKHIHDEAEHLDVKARVLGHADAITLHDADTGAAVGRYTTRAVRGQERQALSDAEGVMNDHRHRALGRRVQEGALADRGLRPDQRAAFVHAAESGGLKIIEGRAGTGKSYTLAAVRDAHASAGYTVIGLAPTNTVAQDLKADGFAQAGTVHSELFRLKNGRTQWTDRTLVVVDEAAMLDTGVMGVLLAEARSSGAKLILAGDDRQLASIERGGLFTELRERHGSAEIVEVTRQSVDWQRLAARDMAEGRTTEALGAFDTHGALVWSASQDVARAKLVSRWASDTESDLQSSAPAKRFVFAYTNRDVDALNAELRGVRVERGEIGGGVALDTKHGLAEFAVGDRVQFTDTLKRDHIYNGNVGTITAIEPVTGRMSARIDGNEGRSVHWSPDQFDGFRHGYAGTIYKGQGKTLDHTYLYHSEHWRQASSYVALTRQRESATIFAATETARDVDSLSRQMNRTEIRAASLAWATIEDLPPTLRHHAEASAFAQQPRQIDKPMSAQAAPTREAPGAELELPSDWLITPRAVPEKRGDQGERRAAVAADPAVRRERQMLDDYLNGAYRDPRQAAASLRELIARDGHTSAARRIEADPAAIGELRGGTGLFAGAEARADRARAIHVAGSIAPAVRRIGESESKAVDRWQQDQARERTAAAIGVPALSKEAERAVAQLASAPDAEARAALWQGAFSTPVGRELGAFVQAVEGRFGQEAVRAMERGGKIEADGFSHQERKALDQAASAVRTVRPVAREAAGEAQRQAASARFGKGHSLKP